MDKNDVRLRRTESEIACEEAARLTVDLQEQSPEDDDDELSECQELPPPPDGGYGWVICFASFMCNMIVDGIAYTFGMFLPILAETFNEGNGTVAWVGSLLSGVYLGAGPIVSALCNKFGCRAVCIAGSIVSCLAFVGSAFSTSIQMMMFVYGFIGGFGFGMIYLPAVVAVGYYFETKRSLATGIAVCGSGFGTFIFAPFATYLLETVGWKSSLLIFAGLILNCSVFGAMMRPLTYPKKKKSKPLMQRMYEEKRMQMERGSIGGSYFTVTLADGTIEKRQKIHSNADPGVHSSLNLDQLASQHHSGTLHPVPTLPTITETKVIEYQNGDCPNDSNGHLDSKKLRSRSHRNSENSDSGSISVSGSDLTRNASQPSFQTHSQNIPKNVSTPSFERIRKTSTSGFKPSLSAIGGDEEGLYQSKLSVHRADSAGKMVRPLSRKDIFYSGSVTNLQQYQSQKSLTNYRNSVLSLPKFEKTMSMRDDMIEKGGQPDSECCLCLPPPIRSALSSMLDVSLLKNPVFMCIGISNVFGMLGLYVPFVYLADAAELSSIDKSSAGFLISIIGITNTIGRVVCGFVADFPQVNSLLMNNICLIISTLSVGLTPFATTYGGYIAISIFFGIAVSGYISLTSIILVDLLGLDKLTNAFGLLILFRGVAAIIGSPLAGAVYDATKSYDIPFYMAGGFFAVATVTSFMAPSLKRCTKSEDVPVFMEVLTPINEEPTEIDEDDQPITITPKIIVN